MKNEFIKIKGLAKGKQSVILCGVHGNEQCGVKAFQSLLPKMRINKGSVYFGYANPKAIRLKQRFVRENLNRLFREKKLLSPKQIGSYEYKRSRLIMNYLNKADILLDIHACREKNAKPFLICEKRALKIAKYLPFDTVVTGFDKSEPGGTDTYMNERKKIGICAECGYLEDEKSVAKAKSAILSFLKIAGHNKGKVKARKQRIFHVFILYKNKSDDFRLVKSFKNFEAVKKGEIIAYDGKEEIRAKKNCHILFAHKAKKAGEEVFLLAIKKTANIK